ncbi:MAG: DNA polymerase III subunit delta [Desulfovibrionaceae bacterium]|nr:DNA polymerase III subunit delta [Desulfovibrionaceae bacterium]
MSRPGFYFLVCPDAELIRMRVRDLLEKAGLSGARRKVFWGDEDLPEAFWQDLCVKSLLDEPKALVLRRAHGLKVELWDKIGRAAVNQASNVCAFFCLEAEWIKNKAPVPAALTKRPMWTFAEKNDRIWKSPGLDEPGLAGFVRDWAGQKGLDLGPGALAALCRVLPRDAVHARLELGKIELAAGDSGRVLAGHAELIPPHGDMDFFEFMEALTRGGGTRAWKRVLDNHLEPDKDCLLFPLVRYMTGQARSMWMLVCGEEHKVRMHPYAKKLGLALATRLGQKRIARILDLAMEAESAVKGGERNPEQALEMFVADLSGLFALENPDRTARRR